MPRKTKHKTKIPTVAIFAIAMFYFLSRGAGAVVTISAGVVGNAGIVDNAKLLESSTVIAYSGARLTYSQDQYRPEWI